MTSQTPYCVVEPGAYEVQDHFYPRVPNAVLHPLVRYFLTLGNDRIADRYVHLHPEVDANAVRTALASVPRYFRWAGADLFHVTDDRGRRRFVVIETNSCPSGQKSMPPFDMEAEQAGYRRLLSKTFVPLLKRRALPKGALAVLWDKNWMENSAYAAVMADLTGEPVHLVQAKHSDDPPVKTEAGVVHVRDEKGAWHPIRAAFRYVTQKPWTRIPPLTRTAMLNPILSCLAGGRNKMLAGRAYELYNAKLSATKLQIRIPETIGNITKDQVPIWLDRMGGIGVVKVPYSNAGQGVYTITNDEELAAFMEEDHAYERFIVQGLIGNVGWSSITRDGRLYHVGTVPSSKRNIYVADLRFMIGTSPEGFYPVAMYSRRARSPLAWDLAETDASSWDMLGTNLSVVQGGGEFTTEPSRLMLMDSRDFNHLGLGLDDLCEAYVQTVLSTLAIDDFAGRLVTKKGKFRRRFFASLNPDPALIAEIIR